MTHMFKNNVHPVSVKFTVLLYSKYLNFLSPLLYVHFFYKRLINNYNRMYYGFRLNIGKSNQMIIWFDHFWSEQHFWSGWVDIGLGPKSMPVKACPNSRYNSKTWNVCENIQNLSLSSNVLFLPFAPFQFADKIRCDACSFILCTFQF